MDPDKDPIISREEIDKRYNKHITLSKETYLSVEKKMHVHTDKYDFFKVSPIKPGQHFLYQVFDSYRKSDDDYLTVSYPRLGIYLNSYPCDQTIEVEWVDHRRTWEYNFRFSEYCFVGELKAELKYMPLWGDQMMVYGIWDTMPNWKQLKQAYERTWWYYRDQNELRDIQIDRLLGKSSDL